MGGRGGGVFHMWVCPTWMCLKYRECPLGGKGEEGLPIFIRHNGAM